MPLPSQDTVWPPPEMATPYRSIAIDDAWFTGDTNALEVTYANPANQGGAGWFGGLKRWFWGTPTPQNQSQPPVKLHLPVPAEIARMSAQQLFGEMFTALFEAEKEAEAPVGPDDAPDTSDPYAAANKRLTDLLDDNAQARLIEVGEYASAHGGGYLKLAWDKDLHPEGPFFTVVPADTAVPEFRHGYLTAVTFWTRLAPVAGHEYLLLERLEPGTIEFGLYESSSKERLGQKVALAAHPDVLNIAGQADGNGRLLTGSSLLTAAYLPNVKPNKRWRTDPVARYMGRSDFDGAHDVFDEVDETFTSYMRDFRLGKARLTVPKDALTAGKPGQGAAFNADQEIFVELGETVGSLNPDGGPGAAQAPEMKLFQPAIREQEHRDAVQQLKEWAYEACGYSAQTFGAAGDVAITATEATAREKLTILSRSSKILAARPALRPLLAALLDVDQAVFGGPGRPAGLLPTIEFPDAASDSPKVVADMLSALNTSESASIQTRVEMLHPDWDGKQVAVEVQRIRDDYSMLPMPNEKDLWAAQAANGSATGGVAPPTNTDPFATAPTAGEKPGVAPPAKP